MKSQRHALTVLFVLGLLGVLLPSFLGYTYRDRLADRPAMYQVTVPDAVRHLESFHRPRRTVVVVVDGLGYLEAQGLHAMQLLAAGGQCFKTDVGSLPMSRPVYGVISTGVEQDRGGALVNDTTVPHRAESIWEIARKGGLSVAAISELSWWQDLFPHGFDTYVRKKESEDYFRLAPAADLLLIHPLYVDEAGHHLGVGSKEYRPVLYRADRELQELLRTVDFSRDLVIVTADHGHSLGGGHGGRQDRIANVLSCFAGPGVRHRPQLGALRMTSMAPAIALLLGLHFPTGMRAGDDDLDTLWQILEPGAFPPAYLQDRHEAIERFRAENRAALAYLAPQSHGSFTALYAAARHRHLILSLPWLAVFGMILWVHFRGHRGLRREGGAAHGFLFGVLWMIGFIALSYGIQTRVRGSFDMSSVNYRESFIRFTLTLGSTLFLGALGIHFALRRSLRALLWDLTILSVLGTTLCVMQPVVFGWHLDFPVPPTAVYFFPYFAALFLGSFNAWMLFFGVLIVFRSSRL